MATFSPQIAAQLLKLYGKKAQAGEGLYSPVDPSQEEVNQAQFGFGTAEQPAGQIQPDPANDVVNTTSQQVDQQPLSPQEQELQRYAQLYAEKERLARPYLDAQERGIAQNEKTLAELRNAPQGIDVSGLYALARQFGVEGAGEGYKSPQTRVERLKDIADLENKIQAQRMGLTTEQMKLLQDRLSGQAAGLQLRGQRLDLSQQAAAQKVANAFINDPVLKVVDTQNQSIDKGIGRLEDSFRDPKKYPFGEVLKHEIENDLAQALTGSRVSGLGQQDRVSFEVPILKLQAWLGGLSGKQLASNVEYQRQLLDSLKALRTDISKIRDSRTEHLSAGFESANKNNKYALDTINTFRTRNKHVPESDSQSSAEGSKSNKPKSMKLPNGTVLNLNPETGQYE